MKVEKIDKIGQSNSIDKSHVSTNFIDIIKMNHFWSDGIMVKATKWNPTSKETISWKESRDNNN